MTNLIEPGLAFLEGIALIASPCILPVLPLVLSASVDGGKKRPFGIITGFVLAFSVFALASRKLVNALGIEPQLIQNTSLIFLALFGLVLLSGKLSEKFSGLTQRAANFGNKFSTNSNEGGYFSGIVIGALIGLIWTPCAGPILAAVLVQVIRQETDLQSLIIVIPFAIGAGIPMLLIALTGRKLMSKLGFFTKHAEAVRKGFGIIILLSVAVIASGANAGSFFSHNEKPAVMQTSSLQDGLAKPYPAPELADIQGWINSNPLKIADLKGKVVLIDFWTYSCINCVRTLPHVTEWDQKYRDKGLVIIGVSAPEFEFEKNVDNVKAATLKNSIQYPVVLDNNLSTWTSFKNQYWPAHYLINKNGQVVYTHFGEGNYDVTENNIRFLLGLNDTVQTKDTDKQSFSDAQTSETYLGYLRAERYTGSEPQKNKEEDYKFSNKLAADQWSLQGKWTIKGEKIIANDKNSALRFNFNAGKVFLVLGTASNKPIRLSVRLNGKEQEPVLVDKHTLYQLIDQKSAKQGLLEIQSSEPGLEAYAFTFGN